MGNARHVGIRRSSVVVSLGNALAHSYSCFSLVSTPPPLPLIFCVFPMSFTSLLWSVPLYLASLGARCAKCWKRATVIDWVFLMPIVWGQVGSPWVAIWGYAGFLAFGTHSAWEQRAHMSVCVASSRGRSPSGGIYFAGEIYLGLAMDCFSTGDGMQ